MVNVLAISREVEDSKNFDSKKEIKQLYVLAGKYGGTCKAKDGYETIRQQSEETAIKRSNFCADKGHHTVFAHSSLTLEIRCSKMVAMILNSIGVSNTSEKSARYTEMTPQTEDELKLYNKWREIIKGEIIKVYPDKFKESEVDSLALENARYMLSVLVPTSMVYTLPYRNLSYLTLFLQNLSSNLLQSEDNNFARKLSEELRDLSDELTKKVFDNKVNIIDNKCGHINFMHIQENKTPLTLKKEFFGDVYQANYKASFASVAQIMRHRTIDLIINFFCDTRFSFYVPKIIARDKDLAKEWLKDLESIKDVIPQATLVDVIERGTFEKFIMKTKERLCGRAQLETQNTCKEIMQKFIDNSDNLSDFNAKEIEKYMCNGKACTRCLFKDFNCVEPCKWGKESFERLI